MNKVLIKLYVPMLDKNYDIFIPANEIIWKVTNLIVKSISDFTDIDFTNTNFLLINSVNGYIYDSNQIVANTDIRNSSKLILLNVK